MFYRSVDHFVPRLLGHTSRHLPRNVLFHSSTPLDVCLSSLAICTRRPLLGYRSLRKADTADMRERDKTRGTSASKRRYRTTLNGHRVVYPPKYVNCKYHFRITTANVPPLFRQFASGQRYVARTRNSRIRRATNSANRVSCFEFRANLKAVQIVLKRIEKPSI